MSMSVVVASVVKTQSVLTSKLQKKLDKSLMDIQFRSMGTKNVENNFDPFDEFLRGARNF